jgi:hypothetical protein
LAQAFARLELKLLVVMAASVAGCVAGLGDAPPAAMPEPLPEVRSLAPAPGMVWVAGGWHWNDRAFVWIPGRWEIAPPPPVLP